MYQNYPNQLEINVSPSTAGQVQFNLLHQSSNVPEKCRKFIEKLGWMMQNTHPDTGEQLFHKPPPNGSLDDERKNWNHDLQYGHWHWYEAMAYEFGKFMGIDEDTGGTHLGQDTMGSAAQSPAHL